jgi:hypothetical protein
MDVEKYKLRQADEARARNLLREMALPEDGGRVKLIADAQEVWRTASIEWRKCLQCGRENSVVTWQRFGGKCPNCLDLHDRETVPASPVTAQPKRKREKPVLCYALGSFHEGKHLQVATCVNPIPNNRKAAPVTEPDSRAEFEKWVRSTMSDWKAAQDATLSKGLHGPELVIRYNSSGTQYAWEAWQACHALIRTALEEETRELESDLKTEREDCREWEKMYQEAERDLKKAESETRQLREALQELADLMEEVRTGNYKPDTFTCQPARRVLAGGKPS